MSLDYEGIAMKLLTTLLFIPFTCSALDYYKCTTQSGIIFSQFPCESKQQQQTLTLKAVNTSSKPFAKKDTIDRYTQKQHVLKIKSDIKGVEHKISALKKARLNELAQLKTQLDKHMSKEDKTALKREVKTKRKQIKEEYRDLIDLQQDELKRLKKKLSNSRK